MKRTFVILIVSAMLIAGLQIGLASRARADTIGIINFSGSWKNQTNAPTTGSPMNLTIGGNVQGKVLIASGVVCSGGSDPTNLHFIDLVGSNTFLNGVSKTDSALHCSAVTAISTQGSATSKIRMVYDLSGVAQYSAMAASSYVNVSGFGALSGKSGVSVPGLSQNITITATNSWVYGYGLNIAGCSPARGTPYPIMSQFPNPGMNFRRDGTNNDTVYAECESFGDSNGQLSAPTKAYLNLSAFSSPSHYIGLQSELIPGVIVTPPVLIINGIDIIGIGILVIFFSVLCAGVWGASKVKHWRGG